ncbi:hypothetical protein GCM10020367_51700 [Streptomyces sannanensis]|uniref:Uncharacterized protein n=1 Tax=Streptomyces sannanensis TaxID=285536 RepID=A0ABP6SIA6_9ACTN
MASLREKIVVAEERLARLAITRETAASLLDNSTIARDSAAEPEQPEHAGTGDHPRGCGERTS